MPKQVRQFEKVIKCFILVGAVHSFTILRDSMAQLVQRHEAYAKDLEENTIKVLIRLRKENTKQFKVCSGIETPTSHPILHLQHFRRATHKQLVTMPKGRRATMEMFEEHFRTFELVQIQRSTGAQLMDPWLTERRLTIEIGKTVALENSMRQNLVQIQIEIGQYDSNIVSSLQSIVKSYTDGLMIQNQIIQVFVHLSSSNLPLQVLVFDLNFNNRIWLDRQP